ncbi:MAG: aromatic ring-hydroxylating dioxygenase subunit alpha [Alphaproteobacteria bacterium]|nr:aromatic ring-hydroxylating dioxygenase subunit alpha [Alphaproteobacteria bacterium]
MMSAEQNRKLTETGRGTPAGTLLRRYWQPAALSEELMGARPVAPVRLMGEDLVLFRDKSGALGLISRRCPHRGVDLCYARLEEDGLRCPFHGWRFDRAGRLVEQPAEPDDSPMLQTLKTSAYPVVEKNGVIFAYLGEGAPPPFPSLDCFAAPESHVFAFKGLWECNWLQALEIGIDPAHASFLHRFLEDEDPAQGYGQQFRGGVADGAAHIPMTKLLRDHPRPELHIDETYYGMRLTALRRLTDGRTHVRVTNQIFPTAICIPMSEDMTITQWHVPVDDRACYWLSMFTSFNGPVDKAVMREQRLQAHDLPRYAPKRNRGNHYGYDPEEQESLTYTGMGMDINVHDQWAVESMGAIQDRTQEHLATSDIGVSTNRKILRRAIATIEKGAPLTAPMADGGPDVREITGPPAIDVLTESDDWRAASAEADADRRARCSWAS